MTIKDALIRFIRHETEPLYENNGICPKCGHQVYEEPWVDLKVDGFERRYVGHYYTGMGSDGVPLDDCEWREIQRRPA